MFHIKFLDDKNNHPKIIFSVTQNEMKKNNITM